MIMRIPTIEVGLAVLASLPLAVANTPRITFDAKYFQEDARPARLPRTGFLAIYEPSQGQLATKKFQWRASAGNDNVTVSKINLYYEGETDKSLVSIAAVDVTGNIAPGSNSVISTTTGIEGGSDPVSPAPTLSTASKGNLPGQRGLLNGRQGGVPTLRVEPFPHGGNVYIDNFPSLLAYRWKKMFFETVWADATGSSFSRVFTVANPTELPPPSSQSPNSIQQQLEAFFIDEDADPFRPDRSNNAGTSTTPTQPGGRPSGGPGGGGRQTDPVESDFNSTAGSAGLGTGAIVGVVIGALAFLAFIILVVWLLIRRRKKSTEEAATGPYGHGRSRTDELMAEKEANAGIDAAPHSPYSDEGGNNSLHQMNPAAIPPVLSHHRELSQQPLQPAHDVAGAYAPYSDHPTGAIGSPKSHVTSIAAADTAARDGSPIPGRVTPHGMTQYAHLVEEGMTEDEIKRLEEEERALDAAIEQAGRRP